MATKLNAMSNTGSQQTDFPPAPSLNSGATITILGCGQASIALKSKVSDHRGSLLAVNW